MTLIVSVISVLIFIIAIHRLRIISIGAEAINIANSAASVIRDEKFDDSEREKKVQHASFKLIQIFFNLLIRAAIILAISFVPILGADYFGLVESSSVIEFLSRIDVIIISTILIIVGYMVTKRL